MAEKGPYSKRQAAQFVPPESLPNRLVVPEKTIYVLTEDDAFDPLAAELIEPLAGRKERDWFTQHFYFCLPLTFGNQHGFVVKLLNDLVVRWGGEESLESLSVHSLGPASDSQRQIVESHFGSGIITVQNRWSYRTPPGVNLLVQQPPNFPIPGITHMTAVVETDNLRRDFTFNLKVTIPHRDFYIPAGTPIGCILPIDRGAADQYKVELCPKGEILEEERRTARYFGTSRKDYGEGIPELHYMRGIDIYGNKFSEHQKTLPLQEITPSCPFRSGRLRTEEIVHDLSLEEIALSARTAFPHFAPDKIHSLCEYVRDRFAEGFSDLDLLGLLTDSGWDKIATTRFLRDLGPSAAGRRMKE